MDMEIKKGGSLSFWGDWFGQPMDNHHTATKVHFDQATQVLTIVFDSKITCVIHNPTGIVSTEREFSIADASLISLSFMTQMFGYPQIPEQPYSIEYKKLEDGSILKKEFNLETKIPRSMSKALEIH
jgi:hypothetical protein